MVASTFLHAQIPFEQAGPLLRPKSLQLIVYLTQFGVWTRLLGLICPEHLQNAGRRWMYSSWSSCCPSSWLRFNQITRELAISSLQSISAFWCREAAGTGSGRMSSFGPLAPPSSAALLPGGPSTPPASWPGEGQAWPQTLWTCIIDHHRFTDQHSTLIQQHFHSEKCQLHFSMYIYIY